MHPALRNQLTHLDSALVNILQERARLLADVEADDPDRAPQVDDLLRRTQGSFDPLVLAEILSAAERGTRP
ncbi:MAG: hypothetical protein QF724_05470 [Planctomycetota bacterium]|jgi:hypothetical protein|nr:hypothetical protein [Planctomycetota bacterium]MDP6369220.1 hypothetical protein [Planctomycetota bacterium]MDP6519587.1 hypothetical protein [Planctomycetota bacterium]MDP6838369.1 hypothetical protein [Planctomycetota bacterium]MDP6955726.1 hypothetical protein [Planctomycetota bacterium]